MLPVSYDGGIAATFGNDVTAICAGKRNAAGATVVVTGPLGEDGVLTATAVALEE